MTVQLNPYLNFKDQAREAMEFYRSALGGELTVSTFACRGASLMAGDATRGAATRTGRRIRSDRRRDPARRRSRPPARGARQPPPRRRVRRAP